MTSNDIAFCLAEDRADIETGLRLAILSVCRHCPGTPVYVYRPECDPGFRKWVAQFPQVHWIPDRPEGATSWNCKPQALKPLLAKGYRNVIWLDSDLIITRDFRALLQSLDERVFLITQEPASQLHQGTACRTRPWNLEVGRAVPVTLNSSVLRVTAQHLPLLERWAQYLADPQYIAFQSLPLDQRPIHMASDQDVLNALLGGAEFAGIPLHVLRSAVDIVHAGGALGYSWIERLRGVFKPKPTFLHATAGKPWLWLSGEPYWSQRNFFGWQRRLLQETSPYLFESRRYRVQLDQEANWMDRHTASGRLLRVLGLGHFALRGLPIAMAASGMEALKSMRRRIQAGAPPEEGVAIVGRRQQ